ncbi:MAG TPA: hypothetical protein VGO67_06755 [Verrucomicrobiae bacterium]|jgi:hypothetical protein
MRALGWWMFAVIFATTGCVSSRKAKMEAAQAYIQGQQQAMQAQQRAIQSMGPSVFFQGPVQNSVVAWREGMKLSEAIVAAEYTAFMNPEMIRVMRNGQVAGELKGIDLLRHQDMELQSGDTVIILP